MWLITVLVAALLTPPSTVPTIYVDANGTGNVVSPYLFGANDRFAYHGMGAFDPAHGKHYEQFAQQVRDVGITMIRFPGGTVANTYHWQRAIGPNRTPNPAGQPAGLPLDNDFGPDEFGAFLERVNAVGNLMLNATTSTVDEVADFVEYMLAPWWTNPGGGVAWGQVRAENGHADPYPIKMVELGNEFRLPDQQYWHAGESLDPNCRNACLYLHGGSTVMPPTPALRLSDREFEARWTPIVPGSQTVYIDQSPVDGYQFDPTTGRITFPSPPQGKVTVAYTSGPHPGFKDYYWRIKNQFPHLQVCSNYDTDEAIRLFAAYPYDCLIKHVYVLDSQITPPSPSQPPSPTQLPQPSSPNAFPASPLPPISPSLSPATPLTPGPSLPNPSPATPIPTPVLLPPNVLSPAPAPLAPILLPPPPAVPAPTPADAASGLLPPPPAIPAPAVPASVLLPPPPAVPAPAVPASVLLPPPPAVPAPAVPASVLLPPPPAVPAPAVPASVLLPPAPAVAASSPDLPRGALTPGAPSPSTLVDSPDTDDYFGRVLTRIRIPLARTAELQKAIAPRGLYITEYGHGGRRPDRFHLGLGAAIVEAAYLKGFMDLGIPVAEKHALTDYVFSPQPPGTIGLSSQGSVVAGPGPQTVITPTGLTMKLMASLAFGQICATRAEGVPVRTLSNGDTLPSLEVIATRDVANVLHIVVINQDPRNEVTATVKLDNYRMAGPGLVQTLSSASYLDYNSPQEPNKVSIVDSPLLGALTRTFPAHSITKLVILPAS